MKIYTRTGDNGESFAPVCGRSPKSSLAFEVLGTLDELNAQLGVVARTNGTGFIAKLQSLLLELGAQLAVNNQRRIKQSDIDEMEEQIDILEATLQPLSEFILPSLCPDIHLARAICRRAERRLVEWNEELAASSEWTNRFHLVIPFINRMSDYLFVLARKHAGRDDKWQPRKLEEVTTE
jgi:cob(I)alamin adenosyltransferase